MPFTVSPSSYIGPQLMMQGVQSASGDIADALRQYEEDKARAAMGDITIDYAKNIPGAISPEALQRYHQANAKEKAYIALGVQSNLKNMLEQEQRQAQQRLNLAHANYLTASAAREFAGGGGPGGPAPRGKVWSDELGGWATPAQRDAARRRATPGTLMQNYGLNPEQIFDSKQHEAGRIETDPKTGKQSFKNDPEGDQIRIGGSTGVVMPKVEHEIYKRQLGAAGITPDTAAPGAAPAGPAAAGAAAGGTVKVRSPQGVVGSIPRNRLQEAMTAGYTPL